MVVVFSLSKIASIWGYTPFWGTPHEKYAKCEDIP
jgi:hypothetical protein